ncbi:Lrp/AsnC family leucine-responsive transcriptional regulator [Hamadaea flava]|uniref:Lrp/AsnC family transcriptional regulator n=1 Tax=Hamadaea flava TaxID=1742688 RepID=A0ABV8LQS2_9ACTN|nr:Lrp/AsnC family transcriptional regulator [Hamadaea flava]MCP2327175.1 Lrp/AsnC family leucine-responsive transcriptional regulator [Hamadaea flava]
MDPVDWHILDELQRDARLSFNELSRRVNLSSPAVAERVRRLQETGVITGYHAHVDLATAGRQATALIRMHCYGPTCLLREPAVADWPEVLQMHRVSGDACCALKVSVASMADLEHFIDRLAGYGRPSTAMILSSPITWRPVTPLP